MEINITLIKIVVVCFFAGALILLPKSNKAKIGLAVIVLLFVATGIHAFDAYQYRDVSGYFSWALLPVLSLAARGAISMGAGWFLFSRLLKKDKALEPGA